MPALLSGKDDPQPLAHLQRQCLRLEFLRVAFRHREFAFERDHFGELGAPTTSQNAALPAAVAMPTPEGPPFTSFVTSTRFGMAGESLDAAELWPVRRADDRPALVPAAASSLRPRRGGTQSVDGQDGGVRIDVVSLVAGRL